MNDFEKDEIRQASVWFKVDDRKSAENYLMSVFDSDSDEYGIIFGTILFREIDDHHLTPPQAGDRLLMAEAMVLGFKTMVSEDLRFLTDLDVKDLNLLRDITQKAYLKMNPSKPPLSLDKLDRLVGRIGYETADGLLRKNHNRTHH